jgi:subtilisin-like proprotein convertase family protein
LLLVHALSFSIVAAVAVNDNQTATPVKKSSKKRKKKRARHVLLPALLPISSPRASAPVAVAPTPSAPRRTARALRVPNVHILPIRNNVVSNATTSVFSNNGFIDISAVNAGPDPEPVNPYSSDIDVLGLTGSVTAISVTINGLTHSSPDDLDMLLVGPSGQTFHFWSDVGGTDAVNNITVTIADSGATTLPDSAALVDGTTYRPFNAALDDSFPVPAPGGPYGEPADAGTATFASIFNGLTADQVNGTWSLFITDDTDGNGGSIAQGWSLSISTEIPATTTGQLNISEFRLSGPSGADDEFIEVYNTTGARLTVQSADGSSGLGIAASDGITRCIIPNGTLIPAGGHYLCAHTSASLPVAADNTYSTGINENAGIAIFNNSSGGSSYSLANRVDAAGAATESDPVYKEGTGYPAVAASGLNYSFYRDLRPNGLPKDTNDNAADFLFVDTAATSAGAGQHLGAPGPENLSSPIQQNANMFVTLIAPCVGATSPPNRVRDLTSDPESNSTFGTLSIRRQVTNLTANDITQLRFRIIDITTVPAGPGIADVRARSSTDLSEVDPCNTEGLIDVLGLTLDDGQPLGGGFNSTLSAGTVNLSNPLTPGSSINVNFLLGVQQTGHFRFFVNVEALP